MTVALWTIEIPQRIAAQEHGLVREQDAAALETRFAELVERQSRFVFRIAYAVLRNAQDSEDVAQETFLKLYRTGAWKTMRDEKAFLARVTWRIAVGKLPKRRSKPPDPELASAVASPEDAAIRADWDAIIHRLMDALPEELRQPLALSAIEELSSSEVAQAMGIPEGTVRTRLMRARLILKQKVTALTRRPA